MSRTGEVCVAFITQTPFPIPRRFRLYLLVAFAAGQTHALSRRVLTIFGITGKTRSVRGCEEIKSAKKRRFSTDRGLLRGLQRVLTGRLVISYTPMGLGFRFSAILHTFLRPCLGRIDFSRVAGLPAWETGRLPENV
jgi:hypothetical protein